MKTIHVFGDSTTQEYKRAEYPQQGWPYYIQDAFCDDVTVKNYGHGGYSLKNFIYSGDYVKGLVSENEPQKSEWRTILDRINPGDYFLFYWAGINDMLQKGFDCYRSCKHGDYVRDWQNTSRESYIYIGEGLGEYKFFTVTSKVDEMVQIICRMLADVKEKGATPIVIRGTGKYYVVGDDDKNVISVVREYTRATEDAAKASGCLFLDVGTSFEKEFYKIGYEKVLEEYFLSKKAYERFGKRQEVTRFIPDVDDNVHYNEDGAKKIANIFLEELKKSGCELSKYLK